MDIANTHRLFPQPQYTDQPSRKTSSNFQLLISSMAFVSILLFCLTIPSILAQVSEFISIDCGGTTNHTDNTTGLAWIPDTGIQARGVSMRVGDIYENSLQYQTRRDFPTDANKYCYTLTTEERGRYIIRATFLYGTSVTEGTHPKFQLYLDATKWSTVTVMEASRVYVKEMIIRAPSRSVDVCLCCATTGSPFISTLEMRPLNVSMYATDYEDYFYLKVAQRVNFGAPSMEAIRYPDDPYDRIWESDLDRRPNFLAGVAPGTERINTTKNIDVNTREYPPVKVMQTAVVGTKGSLSYRLNLEDFPANARAFAYFAEIEDLGVNETRKFKMEQPYMPDYSNAVVNIAENANGSYTLYEPSYMNVTLDFVLTFAFVKTRDSTRGPLLNAMEISRYLEIAAKTDEKDVSTLNALRSMSAQSGWTDEGGDPCIPTNWEWVTCSSTIPPRITKILLSGKNLKGEMPKELKNMEGLTEIWLDGNSLNGTIPDMSDLVSLKILHLENNQLSGSLPAYLGDMPYLQELYIQNNSLSGGIPPSLLRGNLSFSYEGNPHLRRVTKTRNKLLLWSSIGVLAILFVLSIASILLLRRSRAKTTLKRNEKGNSWRDSTKPSTPYSIARGLSLMDEVVAYCIRLPEIEEATNYISRNIGRLYNTGYIRLSPIGSSITKQPTKMNSGSTQFVPSRQMGIYEPIHQMAMWGDFKGNNCLDTSPPMILDADPKLDNQSEDTSFGTVEPSNKYDQEASKPADKVMRRLAQNREAARKSRLRKKAYVQQLENSKLRLIQLEQELLRSRQQGLYTGSAVDASQLAYAGSINPAIAAFEVEYGHWVEVQERQISDLMNALHSDIGDMELRVFVNGGVRHYIDLFTMKATAAKADVFYLMSGMWKTSAERFFFWIGGFRPSELLQILLPHLEPLTEQQRLDVNNLAQSCQQAEDALTLGMEKFRQILGEAIAKQLGEGTYLPQIGAAMEKLEALVRFVAQADHLRQETLLQILRILTTRQAARGLLALGDYLQRLRTLSSLWSSRHSESS